MKAVRSQTNRRMARTLGLAMLSLALLALVPPPAPADLTVGALGSGTGQYQQPADVAVDHSNGHIYLTDSGNRRIDVFDSAGNFLRAFGWGVADGTSHELQTCTTACFQGLTGGGAGQFGVGNSTGPSSGIAVDNNPASPSYHDVYVFDQARVQKFTPTGEFIAAYGAGVSTAGAKGTGDLTAGSPTVANVVTTQKAFADGQTITGAGIPVNTKIVEVGFGAGTLTLSKPVTASGAGVALTVEKAPGHVAVNEKVLATLSGGVNIFGFNFTPPPPLSGSFPEQTANLLPSASASAVQKALEELASISPGDVVVTGADGGPYTIEFKGPRYGDTDIATTEFNGLAIRYQGGNPKLSTLQNGASAPETCTASIEEFCVAGVLGNDEGQFKSNSDTPLAVGPGGTLHVSDQGRVQKWDATGNYAGQLTLPDVLTKPSALVIDSAGDFYVTAGSVLKFDSAGTPLSTFEPSLNLLALAVDPADNLYVANADGITQYDSSGTPIRVFYGERGGSKHGLAAYQAGAGDVFAVEGQVFNGAPGLVQIPFPPPGPVVYRPEGSTKATAVGNVKATFRAKINPEGEATNYHFQYVDQTHFEAGGFSNPATKTTTAAGLDADFKLHEVAQTVTDLAPETKYRFRVVATNSGGTDTGPEAIFKTLKPFEIEDTWASQVHIDSAVLHAEVNPLGFPATAYFQYVDDAKYQSSGFTEATSSPDVGGGDAPIGLGAGEKAVRIEIPLSALSQGTTYHYRVVAQNTFVSAGGPERTFTTFEVPGKPNTNCPNQEFRTGASVRLPDCRAYEMVSPLDKNGGDVASGRVTRSAGTFAKGSAGGGMVTFSSLRSFAAPQAAPLVSQYLAVRGPEEWSTRSITPPRANPPIYGPGVAGQYKSFSEDLCSAWLMQEADFPLVPEAPAGVTNLYRRGNCGEDSYELLSSIAPKGFGPGKTDPEYYLPIPQGHSVDESHSVFRASSELTSDACKTSGIFQVYVTSREGPLRLISILPPNKGNKAVCSHSTVGTMVGRLSDGFREDNVYHAVSADGSRVFWTDSESSVPNVAFAGSGPGKLYVRINATEAPSKVLAGKCTEPEKACTQAVSESGSTQYWGADLQGTSAIYTVEADLFEYDVEAAKSQLIAKGVKSIIGQSDDASRIYFVSTEVLSGGQENSEGDVALAGKANLYLAEGGSFTFIAGMDSEEVQTGLNVPTTGFLPSSPGNLRPDLRTSRVSADGLHLAFTSVAPLTGYDNTDVVSGHPDTEVYLYDADPGPGAGQLACVSCNPSGARPKGREIVASSEGKPARWAAAVLPGWSEQLQPSRLLSEAGDRLYFNSIDALVPRDTNGKQDVYEWERASGAEHCEEAGAGLFAKSSGGCISLISSGQSAEDSEVIDASADGSDVFFTTGSSLLPQDPGLVDVYDAREGGGYPAPPNPIPSCEGEACQGPLVPPNDPTPSSSAFEGAGNVKGTKATRPRCAKGKTRRKGRCVTRKQQRKRAKQRANGKRRAGR